MIFAQVNGILHKIERTSIKICDKGALGTTCQVCLHLLSASCFCYVCGSQILIGVVDCFVKYLFSGLFHEILIDLMGCSTKY